MAPNDAYPVLQGAGNYFQMMQPIMAIMYTLFEVFLFTFAFYLFLFFLLYMYIYCNILKKKNNSYTL
jgi:ABC-type amino acid transport system permease subunit